SPRGGKQIRTLAVTGGTGFVGQHLLRVALGQGYDLRALTRGWKPPEDEIAWVDGALDRPDSLVKLCTGADAVIHIAGLINAAGWCPCPRAAASRSSMSRTSPGSSSPCSTSRTPSPKPTSPTTAARAAGSTATSPEPSAASTAAARSPSQSPVPPWASPRGWL